MSKGEKAFVKKVHQDRKRAEHRKKQEEMIAREKLAEKYKKGSIKSWISCITKNTSLDYLKSAYHRVFSSSTSDDLVMTNLKDKKTSPESKVASLERQKVIIKAVNSLKPKFKEVIMICEINGYSYEECSKKLNCPVGTVKSRLYNAKKELAEMLKDLM